MNGRLRTVLAALALMFMAGCAGGIHHPVLCDPGAPYPGEGHPDNWGQC